MQQVIWYSGDSDWQQIQGQWGQLAQHSPCRQWAWLNGWWQAWGAGKQLMVGGLLDDQGQLLAALPCYWQRSQHEGRVLRLLGSGSACSDFVGLLVRPGAESLAVEQFSQAMLARDLKRSEGQQLRWDQLDWDGIAADDTTTLALLTQLEAAGCRRREAGQLSTWRLPIAASFDEQIEPCGKSTRRKLRNLNRRWWEPGKAVMRSTESPGQFEQGMQILIELHQRRRQALGEPGCFADPTFKRFFYDAAWKLFEQEIWEIHWMEIENRPMAVQTGFWLDGVFYMYQSGYDPTQESLEPGWMMNVGTLRRAIQEGWRAIDFMRGDERYKEMLRAVPTWCHRQRLCHPAWDSRTRFAAYSWAQDVRRWWLDRQTAAVS